MLNQILRKQPLLKVKIYQIPHLLEALGPTNDGPVPHRQRNQAQCRLLRRRAVPFPVKPAGGPRRARSPPPPPGTPQATAPARRHQPPRRTEPGGGGWIPRPRKGGGEGIAEGGEDEGEEE